MDYKAKEFDNIFQDKELEFPHNMALASAWVLADFKGLNLKIFDMRESSSLSDFYIMGSAENTTTARSMAEKIREHFKRNEIAPISLEGIEDAEWILIDLGDVIVHIFLENVREIFNLDALWNDRPQLDIPKEFYFSDPASSASEDQSDQYF